MSRYHLPFLLPCVLQRQLSASPLHCRVAAPQMCVSLVGLHLVGVAYMPAHAADIMSTVCLAIERFHE